MSERGGGRRGGRRGGGRGRGRGGGGRGGGGAGAGGKDDYQDEFDAIQETRHTKGDEADQDDFGGAAGDNDFAGDDDDDDKNVRRMTKQFAWEEDRPMAEEYNEAGDRMEPFNLKTERTEGFFDETGNFVWKKEERGADPWLTSLENEEDLEARIGEAASAKRRRDDEEAEVEEPPEEVDKDFLREKVIRLLQREETVLRALKRLGPKRAAPAGKTGGKATVQKVVGERTPEEKKKFDDLTELADQLLRAGEVDIYHRSREDLQSLVDAGNDMMEDAGGGAGASSGGNLLPGSRKRSAAEMGRSSSSGIKWEYKGPDGKLHGPYTTAEIVQWRAQGFFTGPTAVEMRMVKGEGASEAEGGGEANKAKNVSFSAETLAADFDDDEEDDQKAASASNNGIDVWKSSDEIDFAVYA